MGILSRCNVPASHGSEVDFRRLNNLLEFRGDRFSFMEDGSIHRVRDFGVIMTPNFDYSEQGCEVASKAARQTNFILRTLVANVIGLHLRLFNVHVFPILTGCSLVWNPRFKKDKKLLQSFSGRFCRRVDCRCGVEGSVVDKTYPEQILPSAHRKMFDEMIL